MLDINFDKELIPEMLGVSEKRFIQLSKMAIDMMERYNLQANKVLKEVKPVLSENEFLMFFYFVCYLYCEGSKIQMFNQIINN